MPYSLDSLLIENFRCFKKHEIRFASRSVLVGKNNAGKSTAVEALRILAFATDRLLARGARFHKPFRELELPPRFTGVQPNLANIGFRNEAIFHRYGDGPARIEATFNSGATIEILILGEDRLHCIARQDGNNVCKSSAEVAAAGIPRIAVLSQVGPLEPEERRLNERYVKSSMSTPRSSLHFRNQLALFPDEFENLKRLLPETWRGSAIQKFETPGLLDHSNQFSLIVRDTDFAAEIGWMGHGLQVWVQVLWFLCRNESANVLVMDEPDVYLHADMQRRLVGLLRKDERQTILSTHSPEILSEVETSSILPLQKGMRISRPLTSSKKVQKLLEDVGSVHNFALVRLAVTGTALFVEGQDMQFLRILQQTALPNARRKIDSIPTSDIQGFSNWPSVVNFARFMSRNSLGEIKVVCLLDRDYFLDDHLDSKMEEAAKHSIFLHIWSRKEVENYLLVPSAIARLIRRRGGTATDDEVQECLEAVVEGLIQDYKESMAEIFAKEKRVTVKPAMRMAGDHMASLLQDCGAESLVSGKTAIKELIKLIRTRFGVSLSVVAIAKELRANEIDAEIIRLFKDIDRYCGSE